MSEISTKLYEYPFVYLYRDISERNITRYISASSIIDRFGNFRRKPGFIYDRAPERTEETLESLCLRRVKELVKKATNANKDIVLFSSEGVDSIAIIALFKGANVPFRVYELRSPETNMEVVNKLLDNGVDYRLVSAKTFNAKEELANSFIVDGNCADQLFHSAAMFNEEASLFPGKISDETKDDLYYDIIRDPVVRAWFLKTGIDLTNRKEVSWYLSYSCKWRECAYQHLPAVLENLCRYVIDMENYEAFFNTEYFSDWAFTHYKENMSIDVNIPRNYKVPLKELSCKYLEDMDDLIMNKGKKFSVFILRYGDRDRHIILYNDFNKNRYVYLDNGEKKVGTSSDT